MSGTSRLAIGHEKCGPKRSILAKFITAHDDEVKNAKNKSGETFAINTYNKAMGFMRKFFKFLRVELGYNILDPFEGVGLKEPDPEPEMITLDEFNVLLALISKENGKARKEYPSGTRYYNHYTAWMSDALAQTKRIKRRVLIEQHWVT